MMQGLNKEPFRTGHISYNLCYQLMHSQCFIYVETRLLIFSSEKYECCFKYRCSTLAHVLFIHDTNAKQATGYSISGHWVLMGYQTSIDWFYLQLISPLFPLLLALRAVPLAFWKWNACSWNSYTFQVKPKWVFITTYTFLVINFWNRLQLSFADPT